MRKVAAQPRLTTARNSNPPFTPRLREGPEILTRIDAVLNDPDLAVPLEELD